MSDYGLHSGKVWGSEGRSIDRIRYDIYQIRNTLGQISVEIGA
jgi:hypothetical protein